MLTVISTLYFTSCSAISVRTAHAFELIKKGSTEQRVIEIMGVPKDREYAGARRLTQYGGPECSAPCAQRLWYPNRLSPAGEAWLVELDATGHVMDSGHLTSP